MRLERGRTKKWLLVLGIWTLVSLVWVASEYFTFTGITRTVSRINQATAAANRPPDWLQSLVWNTSSFYLWAFLTPLVLLLARRFPLRWREGLRALSVHVPASLVIGTLHLAVFVPVYAMMGGPRIETFPTTFELFKWYVFRFLPVNILIYWIILLVKQALDYYRKYKAEELRASELRGQLAEAQLQALKMQLHPHFLFNTLNAISELIYKDPEAAEHTITLLSDMLRLSLEEVGAQEVTLKRELEFLKKYLEIEQTRFQDRLRVEMRIEPGTLDARVPNMILQPIVENAIRHGIAPLASGGQIEIRARRAGGMLQLDVRDDGRGLPRDDERRAATAATTTAGGGVGLANTRARLSHLYGAAHSFELQGVGGKRGLTVSMAIPFHEGAEVVGGGEDGGENQDADR